MLVGGGIINMEPYPEFSGYLGWWVGKIVDTPAHMYCDMRQDSSKNWMGSKKRNIKTPWGFGVGFLEEGFLGITYGIGQIWGTEVG